MHEPLPRICCLDLDTFFVSVERLLDPALVGVPVVVGGRRGSRGVVTAASYEVREYGVRSGMPMAEASRLAPPHAVFLPGSHGVYSPYAQRVKEVLERFTPVVRTASIDEFFLDFGGCERLYRQPSDADDDATIERTAREMREAIQAEVGLPASAGIGVSRTVAKMASSAAKPAGVCMVRKGHELAFVHDLPVRKLPGIGPKAEERLVRAGVLTLGQLLNLPPGPLRARFGRLSESTWARLHPARPQRLGRDRPAFREHDPEGVAVGSISNERTFFADLSDPLAIEAQLRGLAERVSWRARKRDVRARTVTLKLRWSNFHTITRSRSGPPTHDDREVLAIARGLFEAARHTGTGRVRLLGLQLSNLLPPERQQDLPFCAPPLAVSAAVDAVRRQHGYDAIRLGAVGRAREWLAEPASGPSGIGESAAGTAPGGRIRHPDGPRRHALDR